jgi:Flp pilus assembly protein protease CpaA
MGAEVVSASDVDSVTVSELTGALVLLVSAVLVSAVLVSTLPGSPVGAGLTSPDPGVVPGLLLGVLGVLGGG